MNSVLDRFKRNYYCWMYRLKLFQLVSNFGSKVTRSAIISTEIELIHKFIERNCNDYSAYSYLINLINRETVDTTNEIPWAEDMLDFCQRGY